MSASMSSRRMAVHEHHEAMPIFGSILAFLMGVVLTVGASKLNTPVLAIPGFVGIAGPLMYWNIAFWAKISK